jgi:uncharacterized membrane protein
MTTAAGVLTLTAGVGCGLVGGVFFAFSSFVMPALKRLPTVDGVAAMQSINVTAVTPPLMTALFGTAVIALIVPLVVWRTGADSGVLALVCVAAGLYLLGSIGVTAGANVPLNNQLAGLTASAVSDTTWTDWVRAWTTRNHIRAVASLAAAAAYGAALLRSAT